MTSEDGLEQTGQSDSRTSPFTHFHLFWPVSGLQARLSYLPMP